MPCTSCAKVYPGAAGLARLHSGGYSMVRGRLRQPHQSAPKYLLTYLLSHSRGTPLSHLHCPVGQPRSRVVGPEHVGHRCSLWVLVFRPPTRGAPVRAIYLGFESSKLIERSRRLPCLYGCQCGPQAPGPARCAAYPSPACHRRAARVPPSGAAARQRRLGAAIGHFGRLRSRRGGRG